MCTCNIANAKFKNIIVSFILTKVISAFILNGKKNLLFVLGLTLSLSFWSFFQLNRFSITINHTMVTKRTLYIFYKKKTFRSKISLFKTTNAELICSCAIKTKNFLWQIASCNRPFPSSPQSLFQSESKCEIFVMVIRSNFNMNENWFS